MKLLRGIAASIADAFRRFLLPLLRAIFGQFRWTPPTWLQRLVGYLLSWGSRAGSWLNATAQVGMSGLLIHDFRRSAVRNLTRSGASDLVAMRITGHKTRSVFDRYNITAEDDLRSAMRGLSEYLDGQSDRPKVATIGKNPRNNAAAESRLREPRPAN